jgi:hypothetical protein
LLQQWFLFRLGLSLFLVHFSEMVQPTIHLLLGGFNRRQSELIAIREEGSLPDTHIRDQLDELADQLWIVRHDWTSIMAFVTARSHNLS